MNPLGIPLPGSSGQDMARRASLPSIDAPIAVPRPLPQPALMASTPTVRPSHDGRCRACGPAAGPSAVAIADGACFTICWGKCQYLFTLQTMRLKAVSQRRDCLGQFAASNHVSTSAPALRICRRRINLAPQVRLASPPEASCVADVSFPIALTTHLGTHPEPYPQARKASLGKHPQAL